MKKTIIILLFILLAGVALDFLVPKFANRDSLQVIENQTTIKSFDPRNSTFVINGEVVSLVDGLSEVVVSPGSASKIVTRYFGNEAEGDLTGDGKADKAFLVVQDGGGSGVFYYVVVAVRDGDTYKNTNAFLIGDRIAPQSTYIPANSGELHVNFAERKKDEPMSAQPSVGAVLLLKVTPDGVLEGLMK